MPGKRGIAKSLPGYYSPGETLKRLGITDRNLLRTFVQGGRLKEYHFGGRKTGMYLQDEVDELADELALLLMQASDEKQTARIETRIATRRDAIDIGSIFQSLGWESSPASIRLAFFEADPFMYFVLLHYGLVAGYISTAHYTPEALEDVMGPRSRKWYYPSDIFPLKAENSPIDAYIGVAVRQDFPNPRVLSSRLLAGYIRFIHKLLEQGIVFRRLYAVSAEPDGQRAAKHLGFVLQPTQEGDKFPNARYILDLETADSRFAREYREAVKRHNTNK